MYSRDLGISNSRPPISAEYLREKYAAKAAAQKSIIKREPILEAKNEHFVEKGEKDEKIEIKDDLKSEAKNPITDLIGNIESDDLLILSILAFLLFSKSGHENIDIILAAALIFIEFY